MKFTIIIFALLFSFSAQADTMPSAVYGIQSSETQYMVSGVLRKGSVDISIKPVHSLHAAPSSDAALGLFVRKVALEFPGYSVLSTLVTAVKFRQCDIEI